MGRFVLFTWCCIFGGSNGLLFQIQTQFPAKRQHLAEKGTSNSEAQNLMDELNLFFFKTEMKISCVCVDLGDVSTCLSKQLLKEAHQIGGTLWRYCQHLDSACQIYLQDFL